MSVVHKSIDLDFLAGELRKHGKVLSRCEDCGRLFTEVQTAMLHRKVHRSVTILLPTASVKHKQEGEKRDAEAASTSVSQARFSEGANPQDVGQTDYSFIMEAIANANETMTFADLEKLSSKMIQDKQCNSGYGFDSTGTGSSSEKNPCNSFPFVDSQSLNTTRSEGLLNNLSDASQTNIQASAVNTYETDDRACNPFQPGFSSCKATGSKETTNKIYSNGVRLSTDCHGMESNHHVPSQNKPDTVGHDRQNHELFVTCQSSGFLDSLDFSSATLIGEDTGSQSFVHDPEHQQLVQQLMGGSSFLQLLNEPLDESFDALYNAPSCNSNSNNMSIGSPYVEHNKQNASLITRSDNSCESNLSVISTRSKADQRTVTSLEGSSDICNLNNNLHMISDPTTISEVDQRIVTSLARSNDICGSSNNVSLKPHIKYCPTVQHKKDQSKVSSLHDPNAICDLNKMESVESTTNSTVKDTQTANLDDDIQILESTVNKPNSGSYSIEKKVTSNGVPSIRKAHSSKAVISLSLLPCKHCSLKFQTFLELVNHMSTFHNMVISKCSKCGQIFYDAEAVKKHLLIHKPIVPLGTRNSAKRFGRFVQKCQVCGQEFGNTHMFRSHMQSHPYPFTFSPESLSDPSGDEKVNLKELDVIDIDLLSDNNISNEEDGERKTMFGKQKQNFGKKKRTKKSKLVLDEDVEIQDPELISEEMEESVGSRLRSSKKSKGRNRKP